MPIINFPEMKMPEIGAGPCTVIFHSSIFKDATGSDKNVNVFVHIENGDFQGVIDSVVKLGGIWGIHQEERAGFFLPWPCACVEVLPNSITK